MVLSLPTVKGALLPLFCAAQATPSQPSAPGAGEPDVQKARPASDDSSLQKNL